MNFLLSDEVNAIQNPALGAVAIWRFISAYHKSGCEVPLNLCFLVLPVVFHKETCTLAASTNKVSGLVKFQRKLKDKGDYLGLSNRVLRYRELSWQALRIAIMTSLVEFNADTGMLKPKNREDIGNISEKVKTVIKGADRLGSWCAEIKPIEITKTLGVRL